MSDFESHIEKVERTLGRSLTSDELRLLQIWDLTADQADSRAPAQQALDGGVAEGTDVEEYEGQFKVAFARGHFEVYFVCSNLRLKPVVLDGKEDVVWLLTQDPFYFDDLAVRQAVAAAENRRPTLVGHNVSVQEVLLRSMGFASY